MIGEPLSSVEGHPLNRHFAGFLERLAGGAQPVLSCAAALLCQSREQGHICLDLRRLADPEFADALLDGPFPASWPPAAQWEAELRRCPVVGAPGEFKPLILDPQGRLYLHRYWVCEATLAEAIRMRAQGLAEGVNESRLTEGLARFYPEQPTLSPEGQAAAAAAAVLRRLAIISGGPGTGKTRTVAIILALLLEQARTSHCRIALAAPTGKAAARLQESILKIKPNLPCAAEVRERLPQEAFTLHRLLGTIPGSNRCRHNAADPLPYDVVVVDEASMVDLVLMGKLFAALPAQARLLLLGDKDQLASVEAGAVLGELCQAAAHGGALRQCLVRLEKNFRFDPANGLLALSEAVNAGDAERALEILREPDRPGLAAMPLPSLERSRGALERRALKMFREVNGAPDPRASLDALGQSRILAALRHGPYGVKDLNATVEDILAHAGLIPRRQTWYAGRPLLITRNDYASGLFNGDVGVVLPDPDTRELVAWFLVEGLPRSFAPSRLPEHETVFAMTVHKSQGSEFADVLFVLPDRLNPVLTRELIYTGITRASRRLEIWFNEPVLRAAVARRTQRSSGLSEALKGT